MDNEPFNGNTATPLFPDATAHRSPTSRTSDTATTEHQPLSVCS